MYNFGVMRKNKKTKQGNSLFKKIYIIDLRLLAHSVANSLLKIIKINKRTDQFSSFTDLNITFTYLI